MFLSGEHGTKATYDRANAEGDVYDDGPEKEWIRGRNGNAENDSRCHAVTIATDRSMSQSLRRVLLPKTGTRLRNIARSSRGG